MLTANLDNQTRLKVYRRDGFRCALCEATEGLQIHHVVKRSLGGTNHPHNLITLCWKCHAVAHGTRLPEYPDYVNAEYVEQAIVEYLADLYAEDGVIWSPWSRPP